MKVHGFAALAALGLTVGLSAPAWSAEPAAPPVGPKRAEFDRVFGEWKNLLGQLRSMKEDYRKALAEKRPEIETRYNELLQKGEQMQAKVTEAAEAAYREDPKTALEAGSFLFGSLYFRCQSDDYEEAVRLARALLDAGCEDPAVHGWAGVAAFSAGQFDLAEKELKLAQQGGALSKLSGEFARLAPMMIRELPFYQQAWQKEQAIRAAETKADDLPRVLLKTSKGDLEIELFENEAPNTVANFISLVQKGYYNGTPFHRVLPQFMAQGGDPTGTGNGGPGYTIADECQEPNARVHFRGSLSMAKTAQPNTGGSQFFLTFRPTHHLDGQHTVFGRVVKGMEVLAKLQRRDPEKPQGDPDKIVEAKLLRKRNHPYEPKKMPKQEGQ